MLSGQLPFENFLNQRMRLFGPLSEAMNRRKAIAACAVVLAPSVAIAAHATMFESVQRRLKDEGYIPINRLPMRGELFVSPFDLKRGDIFSLQPTHPEDEQDPEETYIFDHLEDVFDEDGDKVLGLAGAAPR